MSRVKSVVIACLALLALSGCNKYGGASRYCEREQRVIPDAELKGRLLLNIRKSGFIFAKKSYDKKTPDWLQLPNEIETYLGNRIQNNSSEPDVLEMLIEYTSKYPECCKFSNNFEFFKNYTAGDRTGPRISNSEYFANLTVYDHALPDVNYGIDSKLRHKIILSASNCGDIGTIFNPG